MNRIHQHANHQQEEKAKQAKKKEAKKQGVDAQQLQRAMQNPNEQTLTPSVVSDLHRIHGNQYVSNLTIQAKMTVTPADDKYETEADTMAQEVVARMSDDSVQREAAMEEEEMMMKRDNIQRESMPEEEEMMMKRDSIQRESMPEEEEMMMKRDNIQRESMPEEEEMMMKRDSIQREAAMEEEEMMMKADGDVMGGVAVGADIENEINAQRGSGSALPNDLRSGMESGFGADFSGVRVHTDAKADELSGAVQAKAFTTGNDIFFKQGAYNPGSQSGKELLAHELTHTIQQGASGTKQQDDDA